jgi:type IV pilus assembly protein PilQ
MRLKQRRVVLVVLLLSVAAYAAVPELTNVSVVGEGKATTVTLSASGGFTHNEYRPAENLLLIDLVGISAGKFSEQSSALSMPGVESYHVVGYSGAGGVQIARVELALKADPDVRVNSSRNGLIIEVTPPAASASEPDAPPSAATVAPAVQAEPAPPVSKPSPVASTSTPAKPVEVQNVAVFRGSKGVQIDVSANGPLNPRTMKLKGPDRIVVDLLNAVPGGRPHTVNVDANGVVAVRMGRFQDNPPITRLVVDLSGPGDFDLTPNGNKVSIKVRPADLAASPTAPAPSAPKTTAPQAPAELKPEVQEQPVTTAPQVSAELKPEVQEQPAAVVPQATTEKTPAVPEESIAAAPDMAAILHQVVQAQPMPELPSLSRVALKEQVSLAAAPAPLPVAEAEAPQQKSEPEPSASSPDAKPAVASPAPSLATVEPAAPAPVQPISATPAAVAVPQPKPAAAAATEPLPAAQTGGNAAQDVVVVEPKVQQRVSSQSPDQKSPESAPANKPPALMPVNAPAPAQTAVEKPAPKTEAVQSQQAINFAAEQTKGEIRPPAKPRYTGEPISVNLKDVDIKDFFRLIHEISGLNIVLDPAINGTLTLVLDDVPWDQALDIVLKNNGLDRQLDGNVLRIATLETLRVEAEARRHQVEAQILAAEKVTFTRFLSYAHAKDVLPTIKRLLSTRGDVMADDRSNGLIISDVPSVIPTIDALLTRLDRKTQQVEIDARVIAATRSFTRDIGTQLAFGWGNAATAIGGAATGTNSNQVGYYTPPAYITTPGIAGQTTAATTTTAASIPFFSNFPASNPTSGLNLINLGHAYRVDAILTAAEERGLVKVLSRPRVITQNNVQAVVKQGQRVPITTYGQLGGPPTATYVDAVLRLTVTPQITAENTIFLNVDIENTTPDYSTEILGNPVFLTEQTTTQVLVSNGGTVVIGGVLQANNSLTIQQVPLLGSIPILGNLFKRRSTSTSTQELIFFIMPRIIET